MLKINIFRLQGKKLDVKNNEITIVELNKRPT